jgi:two-component system LytT family response regulator
MMKRGARAVLREMLTRHAPEVAVLAEAASIAEARTAIVQHAPELVFLDVQMPGGNGFELLREARHMGF